jgi:hypothetical protein
MKTTPRSERSNTFKKDLTEPTLLEMSGNATSNQMELACEGVEMYPFLCANPLKTGS